MRRGQLSVLAAGGRRSVLPGERRNCVLAANSLFSLNKEPPNPISHSWATELPSQVSLLFIHGPPASDYHLHAGHPVQVFIAPS